MKRSLAIGVGLLAATILCACASHGLPKMRWSQGPNRIFSGQAGECPVKLVKLADADFKRSPTFKGAQIVACFATADSASERTMLTFSFASLTDRNAHYIFGRRGQLIDRYWSSPWGYQPNR